MIRLAFFFSALSLAAVMDIRTRTIPDWLVVLVAQLGSIGKKLVINGL